jgi:hypothetical protein
VDAPLLALIGPRGSGKSSVLGAGLMPALAEGILPDSGRWRQLVLTPTTVGSLRQRLADERPIEAGTPPEPTEEVADLVPTHSATEAGADATGPVPAGGDLPGAGSDQLDVIAAMDQAPEPEQESEQPRQHTVVLLDQFEEVHAARRGRGAGLCSTRLSRAARTDS